MEGAKLGKNSKYHSFATIFLRQTKFILEMLKMVRTINRNKVVFFVTLDYFSRIDAFRKTQNISLYPVNLAKYSNINK